MAIFSSSHQLRQLEQHSSEIHQEDSQPPLTTRQKRRADQALRTGPKRGPTIGKKYLAKKEKNPQDKPVIDFTGELRRVVGENADQFICDYSQWVKEFCPLDSVNWCRMRASAKKRLLDKIKGKFTLPETLCGEPIDAALHFQCSGFYRGWRYRLKERYFVCTSREQSRANLPPGVDREKWSWLVDDWLKEKNQSISRKYRENRLKQTIKTANGAKSTARYLHETLNVPRPMPAETQNSTDDGEGSAEPLFDEEEEPVYVRLYEKVKRHKDGRWDHDAEVNYNALKKLHSDQVEKHGEDNLTVQEAYIDVLKTRPGYIRGLGPGSMPPKKDKCGESTAMREQLTTQIHDLQQSQQASVEREAMLNGVIEELKSSNDELRQNMMSMEQATLERERKMREEFLQLLRTR